MAASLHARAGQMNNTRTWLSLIGLAVTLPTLYTLRAAPTLKAGSPTRFDEAVMLLAMGILLFSIADHVAFLLDLRRRRVALMRDGEPRGERSRSQSLIVTLLLVMIGLAAISGMAYAVGQLG